MLAEIITRSDVHDHERDALREQLASARVRKRERQKNGIWVAIDAPDGVAVEMTKLEASAILLGTEDGVYILVVIRNGRLAGLDVVTAGDEVFPDVPEVTEWL